MRFYKISNSNFVNAFIDAYAPYCSFLVPIIALLNLGYNHSYCIRTIQLYLALMSILSLFISSFILFSYSYKLITAWDIPLKTSYHYHYFVKIHNCNVVTFPRLFLLSAMSWTHTKYKTLCLYLCFRSTYGLVLLSLSTNSKASFHWTLPSWNAAMATIQFSSSSFTQFPISAFDILM